ncbi:hypothetical protein GCM10009836_70780 [Pseudonocardia ailaonensis]|uniref:Dihydrolipoamide acetyltransferase component of pyruvate dehydrogenase complex n=1 Tax=Pseudonocardia ailaonensis TaxID=367279 RepID=A0ABN2NPD8_9PSEU
MSDVFRLPDVGEGLTEAEIATWHVAPGDTVTVNQVLVEIETAKALVELPSPYAGTVGELLVAEGATVAVGEPIIAIETGAPSASGGSSGGAPAGEGGAKIGEAGADGRIATLVGYGPRPGTATRRPRKGRAAASGAPGGGGGVAPAAVAPEIVAGEQAAAQVGPAAAEAAEHAADSARDQRDGGGTPAEHAERPTNGDHSLVPLAKPPVRRMAKDLGVDLRTVTGSGAGGVITREDVQAAVAGNGSAALAGATDAGGAASGSAPGDGVGGVSVAVGGVAVGGAGGSGAAAGGAAVAAPAAFVDGVRREPIRGVRKATAAAMVQSAFTAPHVTEFLTVDVTETMALRDRLRADKAYADVRVTPLALVAKAVCLAARRTPAVNASWDERAGEIVYYEHVRLGIAAATPRGLIVPKIRDADRLDLHGLASALGALTETARSGKTAPADLVGGTITITNVGVFGVDTGTPILSPGEAAILAVGSIKPAPWVVDGELAVRTVCQLALSFDHRLVDGEQGSRFLADVGALLEDPARAILW